MPLKKRSRVSNNSKQRCNTARKRIKRSNEFEEQREQRLERKRTDTAAIRSNESEEYREQRLHIFGPYKGEVVLLPKIPLVPSDSELPFQFRRLQFPVKPCFAMMVNKSQGKTFKVIGVDLSTACFSHGMFYVAASRVGSSNKLYLLAPQKKTRNVVYPEALSLL